MAEIIDMDVLVPKDLEISYRDKTYRFPGDIDVETTFVLQELLEAFIAAEEPIITGSPTRPQRATYKKATLAVEKELTALLRVRDEQIEKFPFGAVGFKVLLIQVLVKLGFGFSGLGEEPPPLPKPQTGRKRTSRSKPSTTSRSRSKPSGSNRRTGA